MGAASLFLQKLNFSSEEHLPLSLYSPVALSVCLQPAVRDRNSPFDLHLAFAVRLPSIDCSLDSPLSLVPDSVTCVRLELEIGIFRIITRDGRDLATRAHLFVARVRLLVLCAGS